MEFASIAQFCAELNRDDMKRCLLLASIVSLLASAYGQWTQMPLTGVVGQGTRPSFRGWNHIVYEPSTRKVVNFHGITSCGEPYSNSLWAYDDQGQATFRDVEAEFALTGIHES